MRDTAGATILVVEDNDLLLGVLRRALEQERYEVVSAATGAEMADLLRSNVLDLIVLDVGLPDVDQRDLLARLKKDPRILAIPVLVWSGRDPDTDRLTALKLGAEDYIETGPTLVAGRSSGCCFESASVS